MQQLLKSFNQAHSCMTICHFLALCKLAISSALNTNLPLKYYERRKTSKSTCHIKYEWDPCFSSVCCQMPYRKFNGALTYWVAFKEYHIMLFRGAEKHMQAYLQNHVTLKNSRFQVWQHFTKIFLNWIWHRFPSECHFSSTVLK